MNVPRNISYILSLYDIVISNNEYDMNFQELVTRVWIINETGCNSNFFFKKRSNNPANTVAHNTTM